MRTSTVGRWAPTIVLGLLLPLLLAPGSGAAPGLETAVVSPLKGRAVDGTGAPVAGVVVEAGLLQPSGLWRRVAEATTDADGRYSMALEPGTYQLLFEPPWAANLATEFWGGVYRFVYAQEQAPSFEVEEGVPVSDKDVVLDATSTITGSIVSTGLTVEVSPWAAAYRKVDGEWMWAWGSTSDSDPDSSRYRIERIPPGTYRIALGGGYGFISQFWPGAATVESATDVTIAPGSVTDGVDARLDPYGQIVGRLVNGAGQGVPNFDVHADGRGANVGAFTVETTTDARGYYFLNTLPSATYTLRFGGFGNPCDAEYYHEQEDESAAEAIVIPPSSPTTVTIHAKTQTLTCQLAATEEPQPFGFDPAQFGKPVGVVPPEFSVPGVQVSYQWYRIGTFPIPGATNFWYVPVFDDVPHLLRLRVTASRTGFHDMAWNFESNVYPGTIRSEVSPRIKGTPRVGETLRFTRGEWTPPDVRMHFTWVAGSRPIRGVSGRRLTLKSRHVGKQIWVRYKVYVPDGSYFPRELQTKPTKPVARRR